MHMHKDKQNTHKQASMQSKQIPLQRRYRQSIPARQSITEIYLLK